MSMKLDRVLMTESLSFSFRLEEISLALSSRMAQASSFVWLDFEELDAEGDACVGADEDEGEDVGLSGLICRQAGSHTEGHRGDQEGGYNATLHGVLLEILKCTFSLSLTNISVSEVVLTRQNQGSLDVSYWRMTLLDPWPTHGLSIRLVVVVCALLRVLLHSWCLRAGVGALLRLHGRCRPPVS